MKSTTYVVFAVLCIGVGICVLCPARRGGSNSGHPTPGWTKQADDTTAVSEHFGKVPLAFEPNQGQTDSRVKFLTRRGRFSAFLTEDGAVVSLQQPDASDAGKPQHHNVSFRRTAVRMSESKPAVFQMKLVGANKSPPIEGVYELPGKTNYFVGSDPKKWHTNVPNYRKVRYQDVYKGVDLYFYGHEQQLEYDFVVAPGGDPSAIQLSFEGTTSLRINEEGHLVLNLGAEEVSFHRPMVYQPGAGAEANASALESRFVIDGEDHVSFSVPRFDPTKPLIIDPVLTYATYLGGDRDDVAIAIAADSGGNSYIAGYTFSTNFPVTPSAFETTEPGSPIVFITKVNATGTGLVYSTYLGGSSGSEVTGMVLDGLGNTYLTGSAGSDFPIMPGAYLSSPSRTFVAKLNPSGSALVYSTFFPSQTAGIAIDSSGNVYLTGPSGGGSYPMAPVTPGAFQNTCNGCAYLTKLNSTGTALVYSTLLGGTGAMAGDAGVAVVVDSNDSAYVMGSAVSPNFPVTPGAFQTTLHGQLNVFVTKFNSAGSALAYSTYLGGSTQDFGVALAVDSAGNACVTGGANSPDFPVTPGIFQPQEPGGGQTSAFVSKLNPSGSTLVFSGYIGLGRGEAIAADSAMNVYVAGTTYYLPLFPTQAPLNNYHPVGDDVVGFVSKINPVGSALIFSTPLGGDGAVHIKENILSATGVAVNAGGTDIYLTGGFTPSYDSYNNTFDVADFPATAGAFQTVYGGGASDAFVARISGTQLPATLLNPSQLTFSNQIIGSSTSQTVTLTNAGDATLNIAAIIVTGDYSQTSNCPLSPSTLPVGSACTITVTFQPRGTGTRTGQVTISDNVSGSPQVVALTGFGISGIASLSTNTLTFATQQVATTSVPQTVTLTNTGTTPLFISNIAAAGSDFAQSNTCPASLAGGANCAIQVTFTPTVSGSRSGTVTISDSDPTGTQVVTLSGTGTGPVVSLAQTSLAFGNQNLNGTSAAQIVTLSNTGNGALTVSSVVASSQFGESNSCGNSLAAGANCTISVTFAPTTAGNQTGTVTITDNAFGSPHTVSLSGIGIAPFVLSSITGSQSVPAGQTAGYSVNLTPNNFSGTVTLSCKDPAPMSTCAVNNPTVSLSGTTAVSVSVSVTTTARSAAPFGTDYYRIFPVLPGPRWVWLLSALTLGWVVFLGTRRVPRLRVVFGGVTFGLILVAGLAACGGGSGTSNNPNTGTPAGTYAVVVSASAQGTTQSTNLQLIVQ